MGLPFLFIFLFYFIFFENLYPRWKRADVYTITASPPLALWVCYCQVASFLTAVLYSPHSVRQVQRLCFSFISEVKVREMGQLFGMGKFNYIN